MGDGPSPLVQRRRLRAELRRARQERGLTQEQVASDMEWSLSKMIRIEGASTGISTNDLKALLGLYQITDTERAEQLTALARSARERSWWSAYRDVAPPALLQLIEYESAASVIRQFETMFIPGILQTEDYARIVIEDHYDEKPESGKVRALVDLRVRREELLERENPPQFSFILDETAVRRFIGGQSVMHRQVGRLIEVAGKPNVTIEIVPFSVGLHPGMGGPFEVIEFADALDEDVVFLESPRGDIVSDDPDETLRYREAFGQLGKISLNVQDSLTFLHQIADEMK
jgi:transcriptional regulator with XRE-family HTH domain